MKNKITFRLLIAIIAITFATSITSCKKENNIEPQIPAVTTSPLTGSWLRETQISTGKKEVIIESIFANLNGHVETKIVKISDGSVISTTIKIFNLEKTNTGFIQNFELGASISVNYSISIDNKTMIKNLEGDRQQTFTRLN